MKLDIAINYVCSWLFLDVPPLGLWGLRVWSLLSYALLGVLSSVSIILTKKREEHNVLL